MIGERIKKFRIYEKLTMKVFAELIGITQGALSGLESCKSKPSSDTLASIVKHTNINPVWLLIGEGQMYAGDEVPSEMAIAANGNPISLEHVVELGHIDVVKKFKDKPTAKRMNENLLDIEQRSRKVFEKMDKYIADTAETVRLSVDDVHAGGGEAGSARKNGVDG